DEQQLRSLVLWLEDQKIRHYKIEDRAELRAIEDLVGWLAAYDRYCRDLCMPQHLLESASNNRFAEQLEWLIGYAVQLDQYKDKTVENLKNKKMEVPRVKSSNPLDNLDFDCEEFKNGVKSLAELLKVSSHPDHLVTLQAVSSVIAQSVTNDTNNNKFEGGTMFPIMEADLGFDLGDYVLNQAARILRLLYIHDLRDLQTSINECIVTVQNITADPKTDTKLGKVGF
ncbi:hypothetical protein AAG570_004265, partial [Ranatra chinensis]